MNRIYGVVFNDGGKVYYFKSSFEININEHVIVSTEKGEQYGKVVCEPENKANENITVYKDVLRIATKEDYNNHLNNLKDADKALKKAREIKENLGLEMKIINANYTFDRSQLLFNFLADERIDFRELAKKLASIYRTRIELRQIGARDKAREISGIGICGEKLCCSNFLTSMDTVSINMAKNQNLALNPSKINGQCNRLLCCLSYEDSSYTDARKDLPSIGSKIEYQGVEGEVVDLDILNKKYTLKIGNDRIIIDNDDNSKK